MRSRTNDDVITGGSSASGLRSGRASFYASRPRCHMRSATSSVSESWLEHPVFFPLRLPRYSGQQNTPEMGALHMADASATQAGAVASLWRYPVTSMMGEELTTVRVTGGGLLGDRAWGLIDGADGKVATAKNPRKWPNLFAFRAAFTNPSEAT